MVKGYAATVQALNNQATRLHAKRALGVITDTEFTKAIAQVSKKRADLQAKCREMTAHNLRTLGL